ncbi:MAG TPA: von Willebrand factor type A domain-containing protein [Alphaproteobacteria bacterium]|nr:von Willebrand factor type A domain-containing protein [Alphaproteobacteria bacterium]
MTEDDLKDLFVHEQIPAPDDNSRKGTLNLAVAEFEKNQKNEKISQGNGFFARLTHRQPDQRSEKMAFSTKKMVYGGLATACVALLVYNITPMTQKAFDKEMTDAASISGLKKTDQLMEVASNEATAPAAVEVAQNYAGSRAKEEGLVIAQAERKMAPAKMADTANGGAVSSAWSPNTVQPLVAAAAPAEMDSLAIQQQEFGRDKFKDFEENPIKNVKADPVSTFSIDVDTASYSFARSSLDRGVLPQKDAIRIEEMVNYFDYDYPLPNSKEQPFSTNVVMKPSPWGDGKQLMTIGIKGYDIPKTEMPNSNLVFLLDVSGSMNEPNKLPLLKQSISMLLDTLKPTDTISIVVYAGAAGTVLPPTKVADKGTILMALQNLQAGGSTAGAEGIRQAYQLAESNFDKNAVNRVILGTDGDFNVGITNQEELKDFVEREKDKGIFLSVLGFGRGNYNDEMMQILAQNGNGVAAYIDNLNEARKVLVDEATGTLFPIAKDVKIQVEFNPATVAEYRLVGYETRALKNARKTS